MDIVGLNPNMTHVSLFVSFWKLGTTKSDSLEEVAAVILKNKIWQFRGKTVKQNTGTVIGTNFAPLFPACFIAGFKWNTLEIFENNPIICRSCIYRIFFIIENEEESLKDYMKKINVFHFSINITTEYSK